MRAENEAEASFRKARQAVDEMYTQVAEKWLAGQPKLEPLQRDFLQKALEFYRDLSQRTGSDPAIRFEATQASRRAALIQYKLGDAAQAEEAFRNAIDQMQKLVDEVREVPAYREALAETLNAFTTLLSETGRKADAEKASRRAFVLQEQLVSEFPDTAKYRCGLAQIHLVAANEADEARPGEAERYYRESATILEKLTAEFPSEPAYRYHLAESLRGLGTILTKHGRAVDRAPNCR